ncbi:54S ribosomal protein [Penicillium cataractarum]|uniref:Large ribosomal subunit protein uL23m n=1 Tax=Penicillium cataractarum TaxID=2100454 RepID=A0A9W9S391_9EURO|nr:54S ribosomal protein [Penicillium cataractarum]KAJ5370862.1 54S ribosomal protein [Penicillium cataractarum]
MVRRAVAIPKAAKNAFVPPAQRKQVFLPEFVIALVRTPFLSPRYAQFRVPLNFNKLDLRDYLQNLYGVGVVSVRSYIEQQPITRMTRDGRNVGAWRRPQAQKRMTVELREPFVYPEEPKDLSPWEKSSWDASEKWQKKMQKQMQDKPHKAEEPDTDVRKAFEEQAKEIKKNPAEWRSSSKVLGWDFAHKEFTRTGKSSAAPKWMAK